MKQNWMNYAKGAALGAALTLGGFAATDTAKAQDQPTEGTKIAVQQEDPVPTDSTIVGKTTENGVSEITDCPSAYNTKSTALQVEYSNGETDIKSTNPTILRKFEGQTKDRCTLGDEVKKATENQGSQSKRSQDETVRAGDAYTSGNMFSPAGDPFSYKVKDANSQTVTLQAFNEGSDGRATTAKGTFTIDADKDFLDNQYAQAAISDDAPRTTKTTKTTSVKQLVDKAETGSATETSFTTGDASSIGVEASRFLHADDTPYDFDTRNDDSGDLQGLIATDTLSNGEVNERDYVLGTIENQGITASERETSSFSETSEDIVRTLWGAPGHLEQNAQRELEGQIKQWVSDQAEFYDDEHAPVDTADVSFDHYDTGHIKRISIDTDNPAELAEEHGGIALGDSTRNEAGGLYARPLLGMSGDKLGTENEDILIPSDQSPLVKRSIEADRNQAENIANDLHVDLIYDKDTDITFGTEVSSAQGPGAKFMFDTHGWRFGVEANYTTNSSSQSSMGDIEQTGPRPFELENGDTIPAESYLTNETVEESTGSHLSVTPLIGGNTPFGSIEGGIGPTIQNTTNRVTETIYADPQQGDLGTSNSLYQNTQREQASSSTEIGWNAELQGTLDLNNVTNKPVLQNTSISGGVDYTSTRQQPFGASFGLDYTIDQ